MSRPLRIEYPNAWHHVMNRARRGETLFKDNVDYQQFVNILQEPEALTRIRRGMANEPRDVAIYLIRTMRAEPLHHIGAVFNLNRYSSVSSVVYRVKARTQKDRKFETHVKNIRDAILKGQTQT